MVDYELHVWGSEDEISLVFPECLAAAWVLAGCIDPLRYKIVTLSNTNLSKTGELPVLLTKEGSFEGFSHIASFVLDTESEDTGKILKKRDLTQSALMLLVDQKLLRVHQFNLFSNLKNYEGYTRKQFKKYLPFPMMYNQPLKLYNTAQEQVRMAGLLPTSKGFLGVFSGSSMDDMEDEKTELALSGLHERQMAAKSTKRELLRQSKNSLKCLNYLGEILDDIVNLHHQLKDSPGESQREDPFGLMFDQDKISAAELLVLAFIHSLTNDNLPDRAIFDYLHLKYPSFATFCATKASELSEILGGSTIEGPNSNQSPGLFNEIKHQMGWAPEPTPMT